MEIAAWGHPNSEFPPGQDTPADFLAAFERMKAAGIDIYIPFVLTHGQHYFESAVLGPPERDLLGPCLAAGDKAGVEVHPITGLGAVGILSDDTDGLYDPGPEARDLPSWAQNWPCPAWSDNRRLVCEAAVDMLRTYQPDGLALDYLRYPNTAVLDGHPCHCERCQEERTRWLGKPLPEADDLACPGVVYNEIRMRSRFVKTLLHGLREAADDAGVPLSLAARARYLKDAVTEGQDWAEWCREGLLDFICPMSYNPCFDRFQRFVQEHRALLQDTGVPLYCGIGRSSSLGVITAQEMTRQIRYAAKQGADGVCLFHLGACEADDYAALQALSEELK
jgi:hypothetical protein